MKPAMNEISEADFRVEDAGLRKQRTPCSQTCYLCGSPINGYGRFEIVLMPRLANGGRFGDNAGTCRACAEKHAPTLLNLCDLANNSAIEPGREDRYTSIVKRAGGFDGYDARNREVFKAREYELAVAGRERTYLPTYFTDEASPLLAGVLHQFFGTAPAPKIVAPTPPPPTADEIELAAKVQQVDEMFALALTPNRGSARDRATLLRRGFRELIAAFSLERKIEKAKLLPTGA